MTSLSTVFLRIVFPIVGVVDKGVVPTEQSGFDQSNAESPSY